MALNKSTLQFLAALSVHNNRDWFGEHREEYENAKTDFAALVQEVLQQLQGLDSSLKNLQPKDCIFRIYRDIRFSPNKLPYKDHLCAAFKRNGRHHWNEAASYYIQVQPGESFLGAGIFPENDKLKAIRQEIYYNTEQFKAVLNGLHPDFGGLNCEDMLKKAPKDFDPDFPDIELLKHKQYFVIAPISDAQLCRGNLMEFLMERFESLVEFVAFLNQAIE